MGIRFPQVQRTDEPQNIVLGGGGRFPGLGARGEPGGRSGCRDRPTSAVCEPIGGWEPGSHGCNASANPPIPSWVGGRTISWLGYKGRFGSGLQNGLAHADRTSNRAAAPSASKNKILTNATPFASKIVMNEPGGDLEIPSSRIIYSIYGGENHRGGAAEQGNQPRCHWDGLPGMGAGCSHSPY